VIKLLLEDCPAADVAPQHEWSAAAGLEHVGVEGELVDAGKPLQVDIDREV